MRRFVILAGLGVLAAATLAAAQYRWNPEAYRRAYPERAERLVSSWYDRYLGRPADPQGLAMWVDFLRQGQPPEKVLSYILGSQEYFDRAGDNPEEFVQRLFRDVTGRRPTEREFDYWMRQMRHRSRADVAYAFLTRYAPSWDERPYYPDESRYDYRRPYWPYRR